ncbi:MAG: hypothetical protein AAGH68_09585 [Pseudomonadota bacterium]
MTEYEDEIIEVDDLGDELRVSALDAWNVPESAMTTVKEFTDLPLAAGMQGPQRARQIFAPAADPYQYARDHELPLHYAEIAQTGYDMVRCFADTRVGRIRVLDTAPFVMFEAPADTALAGEILNLREPNSFHAPDASGWSSTAPDLRVQKMRDWTDRIDMREEDGNRLYLFFKVFPGTRQYVPFLKWF